MTKKETKALEDCIGALQFMLAFYEPYQKVLDTEAWKVACAGAVSAYLQAASLVGWPTRPGMYAQDGAVYYDRKAK